MHDDPRTCRFKVIVALIYPISVVLIVTAGCAIYEELIRKSDWPSLMDLNASFAYNLCSFALSLLLIFKTNTSYARFWEARSQWGAVYTDCRTFILKVCFLAAFRLCSKQMCLGCLRCLPS